MKNNPTLQDILEFAIKNDACEAQLDKFKQLIKEDDELQAWQTVLGNIKWLKGKNLKIDQEYLETKANYIGKMWYPSGKLESERTYKNDKLHGLFREWRPNGQLMIERTFKNGIRNGLYRQWYSNGQLRVETTYKNDERNGLYRFWNYDGKLEHHLNFKNGEIYDEIYDKLVLHKNSGMSKWFYNKYIYITSDEEIKEDDWFLCVSAKGWVPTPQKCGGVLKNGYRIANVTNCYTPTKKDYRKIILTTNPELIKDGVQAIDDDFLESFMNNP